MTPDSFKKALEAAAKEIQELVRNRMPVIAGNMAVEHFKENFRQGGFVDNALAKWQPTKRQLSGASDAASRYGPLLSARNRLYQSLIFTPGDARVVISTPLTYAAIHNEGGTTHPTVTPRMRRFAWAKYYEAGGGNANSPLGAEEPPEATRWKRLALTKKQKLSINIPQRKFIGPSQALSDKIDRKLREEITKLLNI